MKVVRDTPQDNGIPEPLWNVKDVFEINSKQTRGVYFLFLDEEIVYIGQSQNVYTRIQTHVNEGVKAFNRAFVQLVPDDIHLQAVEKHYILKYRPRYNYETHAKTCRPKLTPEDIAYELGRILDPGRVDQVAMKELKEKYRKYSELL